MKPTKDITAGAREERHAILTYIRKKIREAERFGGPPTGSLYDVVDWIKGRAARTAKAAGGVGRR